MEEMVSSSWTHTYSAFFSCPWSWVWTYDCGCTKGTSASDGCQWRPGREESFRTILPLSSLCSSHGDHMTMSHKMERTWACSLLSPLWRKAHLELTWSRDKSYCVKPLTWENFYIALTKKVLPLSSTRGLKSQGLWATQLPNVISIARCALWFLLFRLVHEEKELFEVLLFSRHFHSLPYILKILILRSVK